MYIVETYIVRTYFLNVIQCDCDVFHSVVCLLNEAFSFLHIFEGRVTLFKVMDVTIEDLDFTVTSISFIELFLALLKAI